MRTGMPEENPPDIPIPKTYVLLLKIDCILYNAYFRNYPYDVLNSIGMDNIGKISVVAISPTINEYVCNTTLNEVLEDGMDVSDALQELQDAVDLEQ